MTLIPASQYDRHPGISKSAICAARIEEGVVSMAHMRAMMLKDREDASDATPAMRWGTLAHAVLLDPVTFAGMVAVVPETYTDSKGETKPWTFASKSCQAWRAEQHRRGRQIVTRAELARLGAMRKALMLESTARGYLGRIEATEQGIEWTDTNYGLAKGKPDGTGKGLLIEYKTARTISRRWFLNDAKRRGYHIGAAWYWHGLGEPQEVIIIVQESAPPYSCACYDVPASVLVPAYEEAAKIALQYRISEKMNDGAGQFSGPYTGLQTFELPQWGDEGDIQDSEEAEQ